MAKKSQDSTIIFRRFRKGRDGKLLDAHKFGYKAWPIKISSDKRKR